MKNTFTKFAGSAVLATLLLSGCGSSSNDTKQPSTKIVQQTKTLNENNLTENQSNAIEAYLEATTAVSRKNGNVQAAPLRHPNSVASDAIQAIKDKIATSILEFKIKLANNAFDVTGEDTKASKIVVKALEKLVESRKITQATADKIKKNYDLNVIYIASFVSNYYAKKHPEYVESNTTVSNAPSRTTNSLVGDIYGATLGKVTEPVTDKVLDTVKDGVIDVVNVDLVTDVAAAAFKLVLKSDGLTVTMLDQAINSKTIAQIMVDVMKDNWDLTEPMVAMLTNPDDTEFAEKFTYLAGIHDHIIGNFFFTYIDDTMYEAVTKAMLNPSTTEGMENTNLEGEAYKGKYVVASNMGRLMADMGKDYFIKPVYDDSLRVERGPEEYADVYAGQDGFARLMLDINNSTTNERLYYSLFSEAKTTNDFVTAMQQVKDKDADTATFFMDSIFLGGKYDTETGKVDATVADKDQAMRSITTITKAMFDGVKGEGLSAYSGSFIGFAGLVPFNRYKPYAQAFAAAGYQYIKANGLKVPGGSIGKWIAEQFFPSEEVVAEEENNASAAQAATRYTNGADTNATQQSTLGKIVAWFDAKFNSYSAWLGKATTFLTNNVVGQTIAGAFDDITASVKDGIDATITSLEEKGHDMAEAKIQVLIADENYTLPAFSDMNLSVSYMISKVKTTAAGIIDNPAMVRKFSENTRVQGVYAYVNEKLETNKILGYIPTWMTKLDWIELPANVDGMPKMKLSFKTGSADIYILSDNASAVDLQTNVLGNQVLLSEVAIEDSPIVVDETNSEYSELHVYKFTIHATDLVNLDAILAKAGEVIDNKINGVAVDASDAVVEDTNTTSEENNTTN